MALALNDVYRVVMFTSAANQLGINVRHYKVTTVVGASVSEFDAAAALSVAVGVLYRNLISTQASYRGLTLQRVIPLPLPSATISISGAGIGTTAGDILPMQTSGLISFQTALAGRANRGRAYVGFAGETDSTVAGAPAGPYLVALALLGIELATPRTVTVGANSATLSPTVFHRVTGTDNLITGSIARPGWATQRRRGAFGASNVFPF